MSETALAIFILGVSVFAAHFFTEIFSKIRVPDVLLLVIIGLFLGPIFHIVSVEKLETIGNIFSQITLVILLFQTGTELSFNTLISSLKGTTMLTIINFLLLSILIGLLGWLVLGMNSGISFMLGATLSANSSTVIIPMLQHINIGKKSKTILILESAFSDILSIVFALAIMESYKNGKLEIGYIFGHILASFLIDVIIGLIGSIFWSMALKKIRTIKNSTFTTPAFVFIIYGINELLGYNGAIAALAFGIGLANVDDIYNSGLKKFFKKEPATLNPKEKTLFGELVFLMKTFFFIYIGISINLDNFISVLIGLGITILIFILRIPVVRLAIPFRTADVTDKERSYMAVMLPRGLTTAVLATIIGQSGLPGTEKISNIVFSVILFSIIFTSIIIPILEKSEKSCNFYIRTLHFLQIKKKNNVKNKDNCKTQDKINETEKGKQINIDNSDTKK